MLTVDYLLPVDDKKISYESILFYEPFNRRALGLDSGSSRYLNSYSIFWKPTGGGLNAGGGG